MVGCQYYRIKLCTNVYNCAEMDAVNQALNNRAELGDLQDYTVFTDSGRSAAMCGNCYYAFANGTVDNVYESGCYVIGG